MSARRFRVIVGQSLLSQEARARWPRHVPWSFVEKFREQAERNHSQTLEKLNERGGLGPEEMWLAAHGLGLFQSKAQSPSEAEYGEWLVAEMLKLGETS